MELFRDRRDRSVVFRLPQANRLYQRKDIVASLTRVVRADRQHRVSWSAREQPALGGRAT